MANKLYKLEDAPEYIYLNDTGKIVWQSVIEKHFDGDFPLLMDCVETNIFTDEEGTGDHIDWSMVFDDYKAEMEAREDGET